MRFTGGTLPQYKTAQAERSSAGKVRGGVASDEYRTAGHQECMRASGNETFGAVPRSLELRSLRVLGGLASARPRMGIADDDPVHELVECRSAAIHAHMWHFGWQLNQSPVLGPSKKMKARCMRAAWADGRRSARASASSIQEDLTPSGRQLMQLAVQRRVQ